MASEMVLAIEAAGKGEAMANQEQLEILKRGANAWNSWREFSEGHIGEIDLYEANLRQADLNGALLSDACLAGADLSGADLSFADLSNADISGADLRWATLKRADLRWAYLGGARLSDTVLAHLDLSHTWGLEEVLHEGPSTIGTDTIQLSKGKIPEAFLRGCGLSDLDIEYAKLANPDLDPEQVTDIANNIRQLYIHGGIQYYSCFISYSSKDEPFAEQLHDNLQNIGVRCWFAPEDLKIGDRFRGRIDDAIRVHDKLLIVLSTNSIQSAWVEKEVETAFERERRERRIVLFPIRLDNEIMNTDQAWAADIRRTRHIGDFSNWQDKSSYQKAFMRLLRDLKAEPEAEG